MTDYAILVLGVLHSRQDSLLSSGQIAEAAQLTQATAAKVIKALVAADLVRTQRGIRGGCQLSDRSAESVLQRWLRLLRDPSPLQLVLMGRRALFCAAGLFYGGNWNRVNTPSERRFYLSVSLTYLIRPLFFLIQHQLNRYRQAHETNNEREDWVAKYGSDS